MHSLLWKRQGFWMLFRPTIYVLPSKAPPSAPTLQLPWPLQTHSPPAERWRWLGGRGHHVFLCFWCLLFCFKNIFDVCFCFGGVSGWPWFSTQQKELCVVPMKLCEHTLVKTRLLLIHIWLDGEKSSKCLGVPQKDLKTDSCRSPF